MRFAFQNKSSITLKSNIFRLSRSLVAQDTGRPNPVSMEAQINSTRPEVS